MEREKEYKNTIPQMHKIRESLENIAYPKTSIYDMQSNKKLAKDALQALDELEKRVESEEFVEEVAKAIAFTEIEGWGLEKSTIYGSKKISLAMAQEVINVIRGGDE